MHGSSSLDTDIHIEFEPTITHMKQLPTIALLLFGASIAAQAQVPFTGTYTQNFDSLSTSGETAVWTNNSTIPGWFAGKYAGSGTYGPITSYTVRTLTPGQTVGSSPGLQDTALESSSGRTNRSLGVQPSNSTTRPDSNFPLAFGLALTNNTGATIYGITVSYTGEQWGQGYNTTAIDEYLVFSYSTNASDINTGDFTTVSELLFTTPVRAQTTTGSITALDGTDVANQAQFTQVNVPIAGGWAPGSTLWIRWTSPLEVTSAQRCAMLSIDDLAIGVGIGAPITIFENYPLVYDWWRDTELGYIYDEYYPYIYSAAADNWMYIFPEGASTASFYAYDFGLQSWIWTTTDFDGWFYKYTEPAGWFWRQ